MHTNDELHSNCDLSLRDDLINAILIVSSISVVISYSAVLVRAFEIGVSIRDGVQGLFVTVFLILMWQRRKMKTHRKAQCLVLVLSLGALSGFLTLGMLGGTIFLFPAAVVIMAIFYSLRATLLYIAVACITCCLVAAGFATGFISLVQSADFLMTNFTHWLVYIFSLCIFFSVACVTIHKYRKTTTYLIDKVRQQRDALSKTNEELTEALNRVTTLSGLIPICAHCKKIRDDKGYWKQLEHYIEKHSEASFSHGICPDCADKLYGEEDWYKELKEEDALES